MRAAMLYRLSDRRLMRLVLFLESEAAVSDGENTLKEALVKYSRPLPVGHPAGLCAVLSFGSCSTGFGNGVLATRCAAGSRFRPLLASCVVVCLE
jgi:hypothetical protein